ncbi:tyrosine--tRNA ligase [Oceanobacter mangrovi]|uniref:tyrosine--tRNA ligase n=1 Tax=Oceanobacter mangrovi TaxID=2862510 RepID=UPI001C8D3963|nr:tyrosine--tRNA ligase [Oceanobacter mangrovi]
MTNPNLIQDLIDRNLIAQSSLDTEALQAYLSEPRSLYCGFDPTAGSLHIGHLVPLLMLKRFQQAGHQPIALIGGATGMIGDPSFKATERSLNSSDQIDLWVDSLGQQISQLLHTDGSNTPIYVNNRDWMGKLNVMEFLRDIGKHFSVNAMINKESVRQRIERPEQGISFTEFSYSLLQSYDFAELNRSHQCVLQIGGNDQWGNITAGIDLTRRLNGTQVHGLTLPLITKSDGTKFGKTESGAIWLDPSKTSPYRFHQFWLNTADADVYRFLNYYSFIPVAEIKALQAADQASGGKPQAQSVLADAMTELVHGPQQLQRIQETNQLLFSGAVQQLTLEALQQLQLDVIPTTQLAAEIPLPEVLVELQLASSRRQARELISSQAVTINGVQASDENACLHDFAALHDQYWLIRKGKKHFALAVC